MAKQRMISTKFWTDNYIVELDPIEKLLFLYLLTNPHTNLLGIYELPIRNMAFDTGIDKEMIDKILSRFSSEKKIYYIEGWVVIRNFTMHQNSSPMIITGMKTDLEEIPCNIKDLLEGIDSVLIGYLYDKLSLVKLSSIKLGINYTKEFLKFWESYPNKIGKGKAFESWQKRKLPYPSVDTIIKKVEESKKCEQWINEGGKYIPHPATWLNQRRWEDEVEKYEPAEVIKINEL